MKLLIAEDETRMRETLLELFRREGYEVCGVPDGPSALYELGSGVFDAAVLDAVMPGKDGFDVLREARREGVRTPVLLLTVRRSAAEKVEGLDAGADDYLTKPFETSELLARVRALIRRGAGLPDGSLRFGDLELRPESALIRCGTTGRSVRLGEKERSLLEYLLLNTGRLLTRDQIAERVWGFEYEAGYNNVEVYLSFLRKKIAFTGSGVRIASVRGIGYELRWDDVP